MQHGDCSPLSVDKPPSVSWKVRTALLAGALLAACGAVWIGTDLHTGLAEGSFRLVRLSPITAADAYRYWLVALGESLGVFTLSGIAVLFLLLARGRTLCRFELRKGHDSERRGATGTPR